MNVSLYTKDGRFVKSIDVPFFETPPDIIIFENRHFTLDRETRRFWRRDGPLYREAYSWFYTPLASSPTQ